MKVNQYEIVLYFKIICVYSHEHEDHYITKYLYFKSDVCVCVCFFFKITLPFLIQNLCHIICNKLISNTYLFNLVTYLFEY